MNIKNNFVVLSWSTGYLWSSLIIELISNWYWVIWLYRTNNGLNQLMHHLERALDSKIDLKKLFLPIHIDFEKDDIVDKISGIFKIWLNINIIWLINNAAIDNQDAITTINLKKIENIFRVNLFWPILLTKEFVSYKAIEEEKYWVVINISSLLAQFGDTNSTLYWASKSWLEWFGRNLAIELSWRNIKVLNIEINGLPNVLIWGNTTSIRDFDSKKVTKSGTTYFDFNQIPIDANIFDYTKFTKPIVELLDKKWNYMTWSTICIDWWVSIKR